MARPRATRKPARQPARQTPAAPTDPQRERAWRAVQKFNRLIPTLNSFVRIMTGNKRLRVQAGKVTCTNKQTIFIRPPIQLGDELRHERMLCDERDSNRVALCPACAQDDDIWKKLHHELAHHLGNSMAKPINRVVEEALALVDEWHPKDACDHGYRMKLKMQYADDYLVMLGEFSPFLEHLNQVTEDARIDSAMLNLKPGLRDQFLSFTYRAFNDGFENEEDGTQMYWRDQPLNAQLIIGCLLIGSGYYIEPGWLSDEAVEVLQDKKLRDIVSNAHSWADVHEAGSRTIYAFRRLHEMGHLQVPSCAPKEEFPSLNEPGGDQGEDSDESQDDASGDAGEDDAGSPGDGVQQPGEPESDDGSGDDAGDPTGDGTAGGTAEDGAFGDDFENPDDRSGGSDHEGESNDESSDDSQVPSDCDASDEDADGDQSDSTPRSRDDDDTAGNDPSDADDSDPIQGKDEDAGDDDQAPGSSSAGSAAEAGDAGTDGERDASDGDWDGDGEPDSDDEGSDSIEEDASDPGPVPLDGEDGTGSGEGTDDTGDEGAELDDEVVGEDVWNEEHDAPELQAARSVEIENPGDEHEVAKILKNLQGHDDTEVQLAERGEDEANDGTDYDEEQLIAAIDRAIDIALTQAQFFDRASQEVGGVKEFTFPNRFIHWDGEGYNSRVESFMPTEATIGEALLIGRRVFAENKRSGYERHLRSGRVDGRVLGKRAGLGDDRLFRHKHMPKKRDYIVGITIDCSGSNQSGQRMSRAKRAVFAKAELLNRLGIKFYITAHTGGLERWFVDGYTPPNDREMCELMLLWVKKVDEPWNDATRKRLAGVQPLAENYDGHTLEFHRKLLSVRQETDKILIYYTDGAMPAANYDEELVILENEIQNCAKSKIALLAVGINTNSPERYGFDTVQVDSDEDLIKVVRQLERHLLK